MSASVGEFYALLTVNTEQFKKGMAEAAAQSESFGAGVAKGVVVAGAAIVGLGVGITAISVKMASDFQTATTQLVTGAGESQKAIGAVRQGLLSMAGDVGRSPEELAKGMFMIESAGYRGADGLKVLKAAAEGAVVGNSDLETTANAVTTVMSDYHLSANQAADATNFLTSVVQQGKTHMQDLAGSMSSILPFASSFGVGLADIGGAMAAMTSRGVDANRAATSLRFLLTNLVHESPQASQALTQVGLSADQVASTLTQHGLAAALEQVQSALAKTYGVGSPQYLAALTEISGGARGLASSLQLTGANMDGFIKQIGDISTKIDANKGSVMGWDVAQQELSVQWDKFTGALQAGAIVLGTALLPAISGVIGWLGNNLPKALDAAGKFWNQNKDAIEGVAKSIAGFVGGIAVQLINAFKKIVDFGQGVVDSFKGIAMVLAGTLVIGLTILVNAFGFLADHLSQLKPLLTAVLAGFIAFKVVQGIASVITLLSEAYTQLGIRVAGYTLVQEGATAATVEAGVASEATAAKVAAAGEASGVAGNKVGGLLSGMKGMGVTIGITAVAALAAFGASLNPDIEALNRLHDEAEKNTFQDLASGASKFAQSMSSQVTPSINNFSSDLHTTMKDLQDKGMQFGGGFAEVMTTSFNKADQAGKSMLSELSSQHNLDGIVKFQQALQEAGGNGQKALDALLAKGDADAVAFQQAWNQVDLKNTTDSITSANNALQSYEQSTGDTAQQAIQHFRDIGQVGIADLLQHQQMLHDALGLGDADFAALDQAGKISFGGLSGSAQGILTQMQAFSDKTGIAMSMLIQYGSNGSNALSQIISASPQVQAQFEKIYNSEVKAVGPAQALADAYYGIAAAAARAAENASHIQSPGGPYLPGGGTAKRAGGGPVQTGVPYIVGEQGQELFVPSSNGTIVPHNSLGSSGGSSMSITIQNVNVSGVQDLPSLVTAIRNEALNQARGQGVGSLWGAYA